MSSDPFDESGGGFFGTMLDDIDLDEDTSESAPRITLRCGPLEIEAEGRPEDSLADVQAAHIGMVEHALGRVVTTARTAWRRFWMQP